jgi:hypothetical protein
MWKMTGLGIKTFNKEKLGRESIKREECNNNPRDRQDSGDCESQS